MNYLEFVSFLIEAPDTEERRWGREVLESQKFDFGPYDELPKLDKAEKVFPYVEHCPQVFNLPFANCLFYASNSIFLHAKKGTEDNVIETRFCSYNEDDDSFYYSPVIGFIDYRSQRLRGEPFLHAKKKERPEELEALSFHYCALASFLAIINSENVASIDNLPSGKIPVIDGKQIDKRLCVYKTLHIKPQYVNSKKQTNSIDQSNANKYGPRVHLRRGHLRRLPGKVVWVQPAVVGNSEKGIIQKDYRVE